MIYYHIGIIYKIYYGSNIFYISSCTNTSLSNIWDYHKKIYNKYLEYNGKYKSLLFSNIYLYFQRYNINNFSIQEIQSYYVVDDLHLKMFEQLHINKLKPINSTFTFNIINPTYRQLYIYKLNNYMRQQILNIKYKKYNKEYYEKNKLRKTQCDICQVEIRSIYYKRHLKTAKHIYNFNKQQRQKKLYYI